MKGKGGWNHPFAGGEGKGKGCHVLQVLAACVEKLQEDMAGSYKMEGIQVSLLLVRFFELRCSLWFAISISPGQPLKLYTVAQ